MSDKISFPDISGPFSKLQHVKKSSINAFLIAHALDLLFVFIPVAVILHYTHAPELWTFIA